MEVAMEKFLLVLQTFGAIICAISAGAALKMMWKEELRWRLIIFTFFLVCVLFFYDGVVQLQGKPSIIPFI